MTTKRTAKKAAKKQTAVTITADSNLSPETESALSSLAEAAGAAIAEGNAAKGGARRRTRRDREEDLPDVELPEELLSDPHRMNFILLLALLSKMDGRVELRASDLDFDDSAYNIVFARSINGKTVAVSVVSVQSGIIRTPAAEKENTWNRQPAPYSPPPSPEAIQGPYLIPVGDEDRGREEMLRASSGEMTPQEKFLQAGQADRAKEANQYPFEVGDAPQNARPMDLGAIALQMSKEDQITREQAAAAERVDQQGH